MIIPRLPFYLKVSQLLIGICAFFFILYIGSAIILPVLFSLVIAILLNPFVNFLHRRKINRVIAIFMAVIVTIILVAALIYFLTSQMIRFSESFPEMKDQLLLLLHDIVNWVSLTFNISTAQVNAWIDNLRSKGIENSSIVVGQTLNAIKGILILVFLIPVYIFMFLFYKPLLLDFIGKLFESDNHKTVGDVLKQTKHLIQNYLIGLIMEMVLVAALNCAGLLILGIQYALLLGVIGAILNVIPYVGGLVAVLLTMLIALATESPTAALLVFIMYVVVQLIDNYWIVPKIVGSKVKLNALISIIVVLIGGAIWGIPGMFIAIPLTAIVKVIFDRIDGLNAWGFLLGDTMPPIGQGLFRLPQLKKKKSG